MMAKFEKPRLGNFGHDQEDVPIKSGKSMVSVRDLKWAFTTFVLFSLLGPLAMAQKHQIVGKVVDAHTGEPMEGTTIYLTGKGENMVIAHGISMDNGGFEIEVKTPGKTVEIHFSFNGYGSLKRKLELSAPRIDLGSVGLESSPVELEEVNLVADRPPIRIRKDTLEFLADAFRTQTDANVEDLLQRLPGFAVDRDGNMTFNGIAIDRLLVNGREFFNNDPTIATRGLSRDLIEQIRITDTKNRGQEFLGIQADGRSKTVDLVLKEETKGTLSGRLSGGQGTDGRYQLDGNISYFRDREQLGLIAGSNNVNKPGFSPDESSGLAIQGRSGKGLVTSSSLGTTYSTDVGGMLDLNLDHLLANTDTYDDQRTDRETFLPDGQAIRSTARNNSQRRTSSHGISSRLNFRLDSTLTLDMAPELGVGTTESQSASNTFTVNDEGIVSNENRSETKDRGTQRNYSNGLQLIKKLGRKGSSLSLSLSNSHSLNTNQSDFSSLVAVFGENASTQELEQYIEQEDRSDIYILGASYALPIGKGGFLDVGYSHSDLREQSNRAVFDRGTGPGEDQVYNEALSSDFSLGNRRLSPSLTFRKRTEKWQLNVSARYECNVLESRDRLAGVAFSRSFENTLLRGIVKYAPKNNSGYSLFYVSNIALPTVDQLRPVPNIQDPLNIVQGNPGLRPAQSHNAHFQYNVHDWKARKGLSLHLSGSLVEDRTVAVTTTDSDLVRTTTYINVDGNRSGRLGLSYSRQIKRDSSLSINMNLGNSMGIRREVSFTNGERLVTHNYSMNPRLSGTLEVGSLVLEPSYRFSFNSASYNLEGLDDLDFTSHNLSLRTTLDWPEFLVWESNVNYTYNGNVGPGFDRDAILWNSSIGMRLFDKKGFLKLLVYDLLGQNINTQRSTGQDFVQDFQGTVLQQYFLLNFSYKFGGLSERK